MEATDADAGGAMVVQEQEVEMKQAQEERKSLKVMVTVDESDESLYALNWALDKLFRRIGIVPESTGIVYLAHVQPPYQHYLFPAGSAAVMESLMRAQKENSAAILSRALSTCKQRMVKAESLIMDGDPKEMICEAVERMNISLLVIGSRGLGAIKSKSRAAHVTHFIMELARAEVTKR